MAEVAALLLGATPFSMYNTSAPGQLAHLLVDAGCRIVVTEAELLPGLLAARELAPDRLEQIVVVDGGGDGHVPWSDLLAAEDVQPEAPAREDLATIIYTRKPIAAKYAEQIEALYAEARS